MIDLSPLIGTRGGPGTVIKFRVFPGSGRERWLLEARYRRPWHLETWPRTNWRAKAIYEAARILGLLGLHLPSRYVTLKVAHGSIYDQLRTKFDVLAVFLGTPGPNRKFVVFAKGGDCAWFIKVPISTGSAALAKNEAMALAALAGNKGMAQRVPRHFWINGALAIEDVRSAGATYTSLATDEMIQIHKMLFDLTRTEVSVCNLAAAWPMASTSSQIQLDPELRTEIETTRQAAKNHLAGLDPFLSVECYLAHGDFTRWNVLRAMDGTARIIDWEFYGQRPKYFDPFHYIVSQAILVERAAANVILDRIVRLGSEMGDRSSIQFYFGLYLTEQALVHSDLYERGDEVFPQVYWQLRTWKDLFVLLPSNPTLGQTAGTRQPDRPSETQQ